MCRIERARISRCLRVWKAIEMKCVRHQLMDCIGISCHWWSFRLLFRFDSIHFERIQCAMTHEKAFLRALRCARGSWGSPAHATNKGNFGTTSTFLTYQHVVRSHAVLPQVCLGDYWLLQSGCQLTMALAPWNKNQWKKAIEMEWIEHMRWILSERRHLNKLFFVFRCFGCRWCALNYWWENYQR